ncbi:3-oxoacyl-[acyl-carrier protein] reductase [Dyadobacter sp. SG02]|uniref:SDR family NAD(P)-dependent oxidoreductase n=1 Tax=Dyadobacter sp. SG02 TaxID=1855291 RepID=UPI0008B8207E|nr:SDR family oxidoreductase [Dyadobacter sp. SG02]SEJ57825.1 3-oxoacyl-[acyl-carrier protein] reductase [Dyadobacter sp. SG02]
MDLHLKGKTAVVTGASQGIGRAIVKELAREGVRVFATARNEERLRSLREEVAAETGIQPIVFAQDFTAPDGPQRIAQAALAALGDVDILINNAGQSRPVDITGPEQPWTDSMALDFDRPRQLTQALLPRMVDRRQGVILNLTSTYELRSINVSAVAKASMAVWSKQLAAQVGQYNIRVNTLQPGLIDTANIRPYFSDDERKAFAHQEIPLGDFGQPQDMADMAVFLVSPRARYVTGSAVVVDGGMRRYPF